MNMPWESTLSASKRRKGMRPDRPRRYWKPSPQWPSPLLPGNAYTLCCLTHPRADKKQSVFVDYKSAYLEYKYSFQVAILLYL